MAQKFSDTITLTDYADSPMSGVLLVGSAAFVASIIRAQTGVVLEPLQWNPVFWWGPATFVGLAVLGGLVPALKAYRVPVAETIAPVS